MSKNKISILKNKLLQDGIEIGRGHDGVIMTLEDSDHGPYVAGKIFLPSFEHKAEREERFYRLANEHGAKVPNFYERIGPIILIEDMPQKKSLIEVQIPWAEGKIPKYKLDDLLALDVGKLKAELHELGRSQAIFHYLGHVVQNDSELQVRIRKKSDGGIEWFDFYYLDFAHCAFFDSVSQPDFAPEMVSSIGIHPETELDKRIQGHLHEISKERPDNRAISNISAFIKIYSGENSQLRIELYQSYVGGYLSISESGGQQLAERLKL